MLGQPEVDVTEFADGADLKFTAEVDVRPEIELPDYDGLEVEVADAESPRRTSTSRSRRSARASPPSPPSSAPPQTGDFLHRPGASRDGEPIEDPAASGLSYEVGSEALLHGFDAASSAQRRRGGHLRDRASTTARRPRRSSWPSRSPRSASGSCPPPTTTSPSSRASSTPSRSCGPTSASASAGSSGSAGREARDTLLETLLSPRRRPAPRGRYRRRGGVALRRRSRRRRAPRAVRRGDRKYLTAPVRPRRHRREGGAPARGGRALRVPDPAGAALRHDARRLRPGSRRGGPGAGDHGEVVRAKALAKVLETAKVVDTAGNAVDLDALADA